MRSARFGRKLPSLTPVMVPPASGSLHAARTRALQHAVTSTLRPGSSRASTQSSSPSAQFTPAHAPQPGGRRFPPSHGSAPLYRVCQRCPHHTKECSAPHHPLPPCCAHVACTHFVRPPRFTPWPRPTAKPLASSCVVPLRVRPSMHRTSPARFGRLRSRRIKNGSFDCRPLPFLTRRLTSAALSAMGFVAQTPMETSGYFGFFRAASG